MFRDILVIPRFSIYRHVYRPSFLGPIYAFSGPIYGPIYGKPWDNLYIHISLKYMIFGLKSVYLPGPIYGFSGPIYGLLRVDICFEGRYTGKVWLILTENVIFQICSLWTMFRDILVIPWAELDCCSRSLKSGRPTTWSGAPITWSGRPEISLPRLHNQVSFILAMNLTAGSTRDPC